MISKVSTIYFVQSVEDQFLQCKVFTNNFFVQFLVLLKRSFIGLLRDKVNKFKKKRGEGTEIQLFLDITPSMLSQ